MKTSAIGIGVLSLGGLLSLASEARAQAPAYGATPTSAASVDTTGERFGWLRFFASRPRTGSATTAVRRHASPPYYSSAVHSLHGRGFDSGRHPR
jgi:hypothetical protein